MTAHLEWRRIGVSLQALQPSGYCLATAVGTVELLAYKAEQEKNKEEQAKYEGTIKVLRGHKIPGC